MDSATQFKIELLRNVKKIREQLVYGLVSTPISLGDSSRLQGRISQADDIIELINTVYKHLDFYQVRDDEETH